MTFDLLKYLRNVVTGNDSARALKVLENRVNEMVLEWCERNKEKLVSKEPLIDHAFKVYYFDHLGLKPEHVEVVEKTKNRVICRWRCSCQVLEACKMLKLDTRIVCREAFEKPANTLLKQINPRLCFGRNYDKIRPYAEFCEEIIEIL